MGGRGKNKKKAKIRDQDSLQGSEHLGQNKEAWHSSGSQNKTTGYVGTFKFVIQIGVELAVREKQ